MAYTPPIATTSGASFATLQAGGLSALLELLITVNNSATAKPSAAPTQAESGSGGTLPAATYFSVVTETNGYGETPASPTQVSGQAITLGQDLVITPPALQTGNTARNYYVGTSSTGPFTLAASGSTASTLTISAPLPATSYAQTPPTINTTGFTYSDSNGNVKHEILDNIRSLKNGNFPAIYKRVAWEIDTYLRGDAVSFRAIIDMVRRAEAALLIAAKGLNDIGVLIDANPGTIKPTTDGIGNAKMVRTWP